MWGLIGLSAQTPSEPNESYVSCGLIVRLRVPGTGERRPFRRASTLATLAVLLLPATSGCGSDDPVRPVNREPVITQAIIFPASIGATDSAIVVLTATDPDGDPLVYDWITDSRLRVRNSRDFDPNHLFNTTENSQVVVYGASGSPGETGWIQCFARDRRGGSVAVMLYLELR